MLLERESGKVTAAVMAASYEASGRVNHRAAALISPLRNGERVDGGVEWRVQRLMGGGAKMGAVVHPHQ